MTAPKKNKAPVRAERHGPIIQFVAPTAGAAADFRETKTRTVRKIVLVNSQPLLALLGEDDFAGQTKYHVALPMKLENHFAVRDIAWPSYTEAEAEVYFLVDVLRGFWTTEKCRCSVCNSVRHAFKLKVHDYAYLANKGDTTPVATCHVRSLKNAYTEVYRNGDKTERLTPESDLQIVGRVSPDDYRSAVRWANEEGREACAELGHVGMSAVLDLMLKKGLLPRKAENGKAA